MDQKIPFTSYDFWAYLSAGFLLLAVVDEVLHMHLLRRDSWTVLQSTVAVSSAYVAGQIIGGLSAWLWEKLLVGRVLGYPRDVLLGHVSACRWVRATLPFYFQSIPSDTQRHLITKAQAAGIAAHGDELFLFAYHNVRSVAFISSRLDNFLNLYGFARNIAAVALINAALLYWSYWQDGSPSEHLQWARLSLLLAVAMTLRYLKFYRQYANEVLVGYAYMR